MKQLLFVLCASLLLLACGSAPEPEPTGPQPLSTDSNATRLNELMPRLVGDWTDEQTEPGAVVHERWRPSSDGAYTGIGFVMAGLDTVFIEHLRISADSVGNIAYRVRVPSQNAGEEVDFTLTSCTGDSMVFENLAHDFPTRIAYAAELDGSWTARVSGPGKDGAPRTLRYSFRRAAGL